MAEHNETGKQGEQLAVEFLEDKGFSILHRNWRFKRDEIDIIAENPNYIAIVEVKTRTTADFSNPETFVTSRKQKHLIQAASAYATQHNLDKDIYFDVIAIVLKPELKISHIEQAFYP